MCSLLEGPKPQDLLNSSTSNQIRTDDFYLEDRSYTT